MKTSNAGLALIKKYEGFSAKPYLCPAKIPTIGYGMTVYPDGRKVTMRDPAITEAQASEGLVALLKRYEDAVDRYVQVPLSQNQFDALVSFCYNVGAGNLQTSTLMRVLNNGQYKAAADQLLRWNRGGGRVLQGLVRRRAEERQMFLGA